MKATEWHTSATCLLSKTNMCVWSVFVKTPTADHLVSVSYVAVTIYTVLKYTGEPSKRFSDSNWSKDS